MVVAPAGTATPKWPMAAMRLPTTIVPSGIISSPRGSRCARPVTASVALGRSALREADLDAGLLRLGSSFGEPSTKPNVLKVKLVAQREMEPAAVSRPVQIPFNVSLLSGSASALGPMSKLGLRKRHQ
jgi:hypothetical protein